MKKQIPVSLLGHMAAAHGGLAQSKGQHPRLDERLRALQWRHQRLHAEGEQRHDHAGEELWAFGATKGAMA